MVKTFKKFLSGTKRPKSLKFGMWHWLLRYYQIYLNYDPGLNLIYFKARPNLFLYEKILNTFTAIDECSRCFYLSLLMTTIVVQWVPDFSGAVSNNSSDVT